MDAQKKAMKQIRGTQAELVLKAERAAGMEAAHHIKVLAEKASEMGKLRKLATFLKEENAKVFNAFVLQKNYI